MISFKQELITIPSDLALIKLDRDPFYRYKMPELKLKYQKKVIVLANMQKVANALQTNPAYICEYFSQKLKTKNEKLIFKQRVQFRLVGFYEQMKLQQMLDKFIIEFLICKRCLYPELKFRNKLNQIKATCNSCGQLRIIEASSCKIAEFIYKNPHKRSKQEQKQDQDDKIYGNREIEYQSCQSQIQE